MHYQQLIQDLDQTETQSDPFKVDVGVTFNPESDQGLKHNDVVDKYIDELHTYMYIKQLNRYNRSTFVMVV